jgi:hypothetical protein
MDHCRLEGRSPVVLVAGAALGVVLALASCAGTPPPAHPLRSQSGVPPADGGKDLPAAPAETPEAAVKPAEGQAAGTSVETPAPAADPTVIVIEEPVAGPVTTQDLVEASRRERERRERAGRPIAVITDKNLAEHARSGRVTTGTVPKNPPATGATAAAVALEVESAWRNRLRTLRSGLRQAADRLPALEKAAADQRIRFYAEDDPYVRDGRIKPEWDRALDRLESGRREIDDARAAIDLALEEGRRAGAEPGWLLEGLELEPAPAPTARPSGPGEPRSGAEPREPNVVVEPPR